MAADSAPAPFWGGPQKLSAEQYRERRDLTTLQQVELLQNSPEFQQHCKDKRAASSGYWRYIVFLLLVTAVVLLCTKDSNAPGYWLSKERRLPLLHTAEQRAVKLYQTIATLPLQQLSTHKSKLSLPLDGAAQRAQRVKDLQTASKHKQAEIELLKSKQDAAKKEKALLVEESAYHKRAIEQLNEELKQAKMRQTSANISGAAKTSNLDVEDGDEPVDLKLLLPALGLLGVAAVAITLKALNSFRRQGHQAESTAEQELMAARLEEDFTALQGAMQSALASADQKHEAMVLEKVELTEQVMALAKQLIEWKAKFEDVKEELDLAAVARTALAAEKERLEAEICRLRQSLEQQAQAFHEATTLQLQSSKQLSPAKPLLVSTGKENGNAHLHNGAEDEDATQALLASPTHANGVKHWHDLSDRVAGMRVELSKARRRTGHPESGLAPLEGIPSSLSTPNSLQDGGRFSGLEAENTWLMGQNLSLEAQLEQVTASLKDFMDKKAKADTDSLSQAQDIDDLAIMLARKEADTTQLEKELLTLNNTALRLLKWLEQDQKPNSDELQDIRLALSARQTEEIKMDQDFADSMPGPEAGSPTASAEL